MSDSGFIFMLALGTTVLAGILIVAHVSAYRLKQRLQLRRQSAAVAPDPGSVFEPELDLGPNLPPSDAARRNKKVSVQIRHSEVARQSRAHGISDLARRSGVSRPGIYKALGQDGNPSFETIRSILNARGLKLTVEPADTAQDTLPPDF